MPVQTKNIILSPYDLDTEWVMCYLLNIPPLNGGDIHINSPFSTDRTPSFFAYRNTETNRYYFKCFSTGMSGGIFDLKIALDNKEGIQTTLREAQRFLIKTYLETNKDFTLLRNRPILNGKGKVTGFSLKEWTSEERNFWARFYIPEKILEKYNVQPIREFSMEKLKNGTLENYVFNQGMMFGYFRMDGSLHKIYRPGNKPKAIKVGKDYVEGFDQVQLGQENLLITKSTKDVMGFMALEFGGWDAISPDSENVLLKKEFIEEQRLKYKKIKVLMDNDKAGIISTERYGKEFGLEGISFDMGFKDLTDTMEYYGPDLVRAQLNQYL